MMLREGITYSRAERFFKIRILLSLVSGLELVNIKAPALHNAYHPLHKTSFHFIIHCLFQLILHSWAPISLNPEP